MLASIRKFSSSIYAKVFLFIVAIPFVFWGMGDVFRGGNKNTIFKIENEKFSTQEFVKWVEYNAPLNEEILDDNTMQNLLSKFIGEKLVETEMNSFGIDIPEESLAYIIRNEKIFQKNNKFSRQEYEKFLLNNNLNAVTFEKNIKEQIKKKQLFNFIGGGIVPSDFLINKIYNDINQKRHVDLINLDNISKNNFTQKEIEEFYNLNKSSFIEEYKLINFVELNVKNLTGNEEFDDLFFERIDNIDDLIAENKKFETILKNFNLEDQKTLKLTQNIADKDSIEKSNFPYPLVNKVFNIDDNDQKTFLLQEKDKYFIIEILETKTYQKKLDDSGIKKEILSKLELQTKRKFISELIDKIRNNNFNRKDFDKFSKENNVEIKKVKLESKNDNKSLKKELVDQIYSIPLKSVFIITDITISENYLVFVNRVENTKIKKDSDEYIEYTNLHKTKTVNSLYDSYDIYLKNKYKIEINYKALETAHSYFR